MEGAEEEKSEKLLISERRLKLFTVELVKPRNISKLRNLQRSQSDPATETDRKNWEEILVELAVELVTSFNIQFCSVVGWKCSPNKEKRIMSQLAEEVITRILSQLKDLTPITEIKHLTAALLKGKNPSK